MISFENFDYDIIVLIIISFSCIFGAYYGIKREARHFLTILLPLIILHFSFEKMFYLVSSKIKIIAYYNNQSEKSSKLIILLLFAFLYYVVLFLLVLLIISAFRLKNEKLLLAYETKKTRFLGALLGTIKGYIISFIVLCFISNIFVINYNRPITSFISSTSKKISYISQYDVIKNACESYDNLYYQIVVIFGEKAQEIYEIAIQDNDFEHELIQEKDEVLKEYLNYLYLKDDFYDYKTKRELEKYFKYKDLFIKELNLSTCDLDDYCLMMKEQITINPNLVLSILRSVLIKDDFYENYYLLENTNGKKIKIVNFEDCYFEFVYQIILINYPDIKRISKLSEDNIFINCYIESVDLINKELLIK